ncbi:MarR family transcriptional regulator [Kitasatospora sp. NPDC090308]|uniref:MarR family transcriptional regulator n=1 Tax=Kitasatospora sp. NPDC090308 TaxID=3364082 RepID=UPI003819AD28
MRGGHVRGPADERVAPGAGPGPRRAPAPPRRGRTGADGPRPYHRAAPAALAALGPHTQRGPATRLRPDPGDPARAADLLAAHGWIDRARDPADRRRLTLTDAGRTRLAALQAEARAVQDDLLARLDPAERAAPHGLPLRLHTATPG